MYMLWQTINYMTEEGLDQLKIEIRRLRQKEGLRRFQMIKEAREKET